MSDTRPPRYDWPAIGFAMALFAFVFTVIVVAAVTSGRTIPNLDAPIYVRSMPSAKAPRSAIAAGIAAVTSEPVKVDEAPSVRPAPSAEVAPPGHVDLRYQIEEGWSISPYSRVKTVSVSAGVNE